MPTRLRYLPWDAQPQEAVSLNAEHPLAPYCVGGWVSSHAGVLVRVGGVQGLTRSGTTQEVNRQGFGTRFGATYAATDIISLPDTDEQKFLNLDATVIAGVTAGTLTTGEYRTIWAIRNATTQVAAVVLGLDGATYTGGRLGLSLGGADSLGTSGSAKQNEYAVYGVQWGANGRRLYVNGALDATNANNAQIVSAAIQPSLGNRQGGGRPLNGVLHWWFGFNINVGDDWHARIAADPWQLIEPRRIFVPVSAGGGATSDLAATGNSGTFSGTANSPATATLAQTGASGALSASAYPLVTAALSQAGASGIFVGSAFSPATAALAATGQSGAFSGAANSPATATLEATGSSGALSASASTSTTVDLAITGDSGALSAVASAPASASAALLGASGSLLASAATEALAVLAAQGGEGAFAGSAYPLTQADLAALGASGAFSGSASTVATAQAAITGASGDLSAAAWTPATASTAVTGGSGTLLATVTGASGTAGAADVWNYVLSNGKTAEQTAVETHAMLTALTAALSGQVAPGISILEAQRIILAAVSGPTDGIGTLTERYYSPDGIKARITASFDGNNNRTSVTLDGSA